MTKKSAVIKANNSGKPRGKGKPFTKDNPETGEKDPRINRRGAPTKDQIGERDLWQKTFAEYLFDDKGRVILDEVTGKPLTRLQARIRVATSSRNAHEFAIALERAYGKVPQPVTGGGENGEIVIKGYLKISPDDWKKGDDSK